MDAALQSSGDMAQNLTFKLVLFHMPFEIERKQSNGLQQGVVDVRWHCREFDLDLFGSGDGDPNRHQPPV